MNLPDVVEVEVVDERRDDQGRVVGVATPAAVIPALVVPMAASTRQREYGEELQATHEAWFPASAPLTLRSAVVVRVARGDPAVAGRRFAVKTLMNAAGRLLKATLAPAPTP